MRSSLIISVREDRPGTLCFPTPRGTVFAGFAYNARLRARGCLGMGSKLGSQWHTAPGRSRHGLEKWPGKPEPNDSSRHDPVRSLDEALRPVPRCWGAGGPGEPFGACESFLDREAGGEGAEFLLQVLRDSIVGHVITASRAGSDAKVPAVFLIYRVIQVALVYNVL